MGLGTTDQVKHGGWHEGELWGKVEAKEMKPWVLIPKREKKSVEQFKIKSGNETKESQGLTSRTRCLHTAKISKSGCACLHPTGGPVDSPANSFWGATCGRSTGPRTREFFNCNPGCKHEHRKNWVRQNCWQILKAREFGWFPENGPEIFGHPTFSIGNGKHSHHL